MKHFSFWKKPLIYFLAFSMVLPGYLAMGLGSISTAKAAGEVTTNTATGITATDATLNGTNGTGAATGHSFWVSTATFDTSSPTIPANVYSTPDMGTLAGNATFSATLSSLTTSGLPVNLPAITPNTPYYYAAWSDVGGVWYPGSIQSFTTLSLDTTPPVVSGIGFTSQVGSNPISILPGSVAGGFYLKTDGNSATNFRLQYVAGASANEPLKSEYDGLYLTPSAPTTTALTAYYQARFPDWATNPYYQYLVAALDGVTRPFAYIKTDGVDGNLQLVDAAQHDILANDAPMTIPGDFPEGPYTVSGSIHDLAGNATSQTYTVIIDHTAPVIAFHSDETAVATSVSGAVVTYGIPNAHDNIDGDMPADCTQASGTLFPVGTTQITCSKTDAAGNAAIPTNFNVIVSPYPGPALDGFTINPNDGVNTNATPQIWTHVTDLSSDLVRCQYQWMTDVDAWSGWIDNTYYPDQLGDGTPVVGAGACMSPNITTSVGATTFSGELRVTDALGVSVDSGIKTFGINNVTPTVGVSSVSTNNHPLPTVTGTVGDPTDYVWIDIHPADYSSNYYYPATNNGDGTWSAPVTDAIPVGSYVLDATATNFLNYGYASGTYDVTAYGPVLSNYQVVPSFGGVTSSTPYLYTEISDATGNISSCQYQYSTDVDPQTGWLDATFTPFLQADGVTPIPGAGYCMSPSINTSAGATTFTGELRVTDSNSVTTNSGATTLTISNVAPVVTVNNVLTNNNPLPTITGTIDDPTASLFPVMIYNSDFSIFFSYNAVNNGDGTWSAAVTDALPDGTYTIDVTGYNNINFGYATGSYVVDTIPPVITIDPYNTNPTNQDITVTASTNEGTLNTATHTFTDNGSFDFVATDAAGNVTTQTVTITNIDKVAPVITIDPYNTNPTNQDITVTASTNEGTLNTATHTFTDNGSFDFVATDAAGNVTTRTVTITNIDKVNPIVSKVDSNTADGSYKAGDKVEFTVEFSKNVIVTGTPQLKLATGDVDEYATYKSGSGTKILTFEYVVLAGDMASDLDYAGTDALELNGGTIADAVNNDANLTLPEVGTFAADHAIVIDTRPVISGEVTSLITSTTATISWTTDHDSTSTVVYDTISRPIGVYPYYGYRYSVTVAGKVTAHSVTITGLTPGTVYYFRTVSEGSPVGVSPEMSFTTSATPVATVTPAIVEATSTSGTGTSSGSGSGSSSSVAQTTPATTTPAATDQGQVKAAETTAPVSDDSFNWTPWIILIIIIALAGAATGGYFYWTRGEEMAGAGAVTVSTKTAPKKTVASAKKTGAPKKTNRW
jgi:hypothetical protein